MGHPNYIAGGAILFSGLLIAGALSGEVKDYGFLSKFYTILAVVVLVMIILLFALSYLNRGDLDTPELQEDTLAISAMPPLHSKHKTPETKDGISVVGRLEEMRDRLQKEIANLRRRGNFNLGLGLAMALVALGLLGWFVFLVAAESKQRSAPVPSVDWKEFISVQGMRYSLVVLAGGFSFFFLRLYSSSLDNIRYYQNELTNLELRMTALDIALVKEADVTEKILEALTATERNFVLKQGETTIDLERARHELASAKDILDRLNTFFLSRDSSESTRSRR